MYNIGYVNANSLNDGKFAQAVRLLEKSFDFLFIAEHWYQHHESRLAHPLVHSSTISRRKPTHKPLKGRDHGGIYLLVKPHLRSLIQQTTCTHHSITVTIPGLRFAGVYYPPDSITDQDIVDDLQEIGSIDFLVGDINTRFYCNGQHKKQQQQSGPLARSLLFQSWAVNNNMFHLSNTVSHDTADKIPDHAFASGLNRSHIQLILQSTNSLSFPTDANYLLQIKFNKKPSIDTTTNTNNEFEPAQPLNHIPTRFHIQRLRKPEVATRYRKAWTSLETLATSTSQSDIFDVDMLDLILCSTVQAISETVLGTYQPEQARKQHDRVQEKLSGTIDIPSSIQLLRRAQRPSTATSPLISASATTT